MARLVRLLVAPLAGGAFVIFLPAIGFALIGYYAVAAFSRAVLQALDALTPPCHKES
jgi:hypothetical protein